MRYGSETSTTKPKSESAAGREISNLERDPTAGDLKDSRDETRRMPLQGQGREQGEKIFAGIYDGSG